MFTAAEDFGSLFSFSVLERYDCVQDHRLQASVNRTTKISPLCVVGKAKNWNENSPRMVKQRHVYSPETAFKLALFIWISHFAMNIIMVLACQTTNVNSAKYSNFTNLPKRIPAKIPGHTVYKLCACVL